MKFKEYLNLGCGYQHHLAWTNVDFRSTGPGVIAHNFLDGIPFPDASFQVIYNSHVLEHFSKQQASSFIRECYRILKNNGIIRVVVPDLEQIIRLYLISLKRAILGQKEWERNYDWIMLELYDQVVRNYSGGEMADYLAKRPIPNEPFVFRRLGSDGVNLIETLKRVGRKRPERQLSSKEIGQFRVSGEIHQWMYDRYSLSRLLKSAGFRYVRVCNADESSIPEFNSFFLDIDENNAVRKPSSLFMEARKCIKKPVSEEYGKLILDKQLKIKKNSALCKIVNEKITLEDLEEGVLSYKPNPKIVHICMQDFGGAGKAAYRLHKGLQDIGMNSTMLVYNKKSGDSSVKVFPEYFPSDSVSCSDVNNYLSPLWSKQLQRWHLLLSQYPKRPKGLEMFTDIKSELKLELIREMQEADIINLHWVSGVVDFSSYSEILSNKLIIWTLHDMNPFTGGCHYAGECNNFKTECGKCPQLGSEDFDDLSRYSWNKKFEAYKNLNIHVVTPSQWLGHCAKESALFSPFPVNIIPYGFPLDRFKPYPNIGIPKVPSSAKIILFGADSLANKRKGFEFLLEALNRLIEKGTQEFYLMTFGALPKGIKLSKKYPVLNAGQVGDENQLAMIYSVASVFVLPSLEDNLPNTICEAIACGTPVVGFRVGGIPDIIQHKETGYLANRYDVDSLVEGIEWVMAAYDAGVDLKSKCRSHAVKNYSLTEQAKKYKNLYEKKLNAMRD